jgi:bifunctional non-homologous end joining protein LigD
VTTRSGASKPDALTRYRNKRAAAQTPEPVGRAARESARHAPTPASPVFVVQLHRARRLHFDLRLEIDGVLRSWAVPKGPSRDPSEKRFAALVEDHPLEYANFEGVIPEGNYGAGCVVVWDRGVYYPHGDMVSGLARGKLLFDLQGCKLRGRFTLVRMKKPTEWLFIKEHDGFVATEPLPDDSVLSGLTVEDRGDPTRKRAPLLAALRRARLPDFAATTVDPMLARAGEPFDRKGWLFEFKYDGYRMLLERRAGRVRLRSRNALDLTTQFPELVDAARRLPLDSFTIDGEAVVHDATGRPDFEALAQRARRTSAVATRDSARHRPATLYAFDLIEADGRDLRKWPLLRRKDTLEQLLPTAGVIRFSEHVFDQGRAAFAAARELGLEGVVGKRSASPYQSGRSGDWVKVRAEHRDDFVVAGWIPARGNPGDLGALALGQYRDGVLTYAGRVGTGFDTATRQQLLVRLRGLARQTARRRAGRSALIDDDAVRWVDPELVCEVAYREVTRLGHLRHPVFRRLRDDKAASECVSRDESRPARAAAVPARHDVVVTHREKIYFPSKSLTKGDLIDYYEAIARWMLPYLRDRPVVLTRFPDGITGKSFYQRDAPRHVPDWVRHEVLWSDGAGREIRYFVLDDVDSLRYVANLGAIPIHTWHCRVAQLERPDWCVLDLDPKSAPFAHVVAIARALHTLTEEIGLPSYLKTSGASGLHVLVPLGGALTHEQSRTLAELLARIVVAREPGIATIARSVRRRGGRVYVDTLQNGRGRVLVAPFSVRAEAAASVSMPLAWHELSAARGNASFHIGNARRRMERLGRDPLAGLLHDTPDLLSILERLTGIARATL